MENKIWEETLDFRVLFESSPGLIAILLPDFTIAAVSDKYLEASMRTRDELIGRNVFVAFPDNPAENKATRCADLRLSLEKVVATKKADRTAYYRCDVRQSAIDGGAFLEKYWQANNSPVLDAEGEIRYIVHQIEDVSDRVSLEKRLAEQNRAARASVDRILSNLSDSFFRLDRDFRYTYVNRATIEMFGISEREFLSKTLWELFPDAAGTEYEKELNRAFREQIPIVFEYHYKPLDRWFENRVFPSADGLSIFVSEITARKNAELRLSETNAVLNAINLNTPTLIYVKDCESRIVSANPATCRVLGKTLPEIINKKPAEYINNPADAAAICRNDLQIITSGKTETFEEEVQMFDRKRVFLSTKTPRFDENGEAVGLIGISVDITERKRSEQALRETQSRLEASLTGANLGVWTYNVETGEFWADERAKKLHGYEPTELLTFEKAGACLHPADRDASQAAFTKSIENRSLLQLENRIVQPNGSICWIASFAQFVPTENGGIFYGIAQDITARKAAEEKLRESEDKFRNLADNISQLAWMADPSGWIFWYNERWYDFTGTTFEEMQGWQWQKVHHSDYVEAVTNRFKKCIETGEPWEDTFPLRSKDGEYRWFLSRALPIRDREGKIVRWFGTNTDVTEIRRTRRELEEANALLDTLFDQAPVGFGYWDEKLRFSRVNRALAEMNGFSIEEHLGKTVAELLPEVAAGVMEAFAHVVETGEALVNLEAEGKTPANPNEHRYWNVSYYPINLEGKIAGVGAVCQEITERKKAEAERERLLASEQEARREAETANRMKDEFLATVSHELRTPLNAILGWATIVRQGGYQPEMMQRAFEIVERNARNQEQLIADILDVSRIITGKLNLERESVDLASVVNAAIDTVRPAVESKRINLVVDLANDVRPIIGDAQRLQQVVWNLLSNAAKFTPQGGTILVSLESGDNQFAEIIVQDSGEGIAPEFLPFVFDRFRQAEGGSNRKHGGLGLGLSIVRHLVELHGGTVSVESKGKGFGAAFTVRIPLSVSNDAKENGNEKQSVSEFSDDENLPSAINNKGELAGIRALVIDDEPDALELSSLILAAQGAVVTTARSAAEALEQLQNASFDVLVSDLGMPGEDGFELMRKIKSLNNSANIPAVAVTAYARDEDSRKALAAGFNAHLPKPVNAKDLTQLVKSLLK